MTRKSGMALKKRIAIAFICIVLIPVLISAAFFIVLARQTMRQISKEYGISNPSLENLYNNSLLISNKMDEDAALFREDIEKDPGLLENTDYLNEKNEQAKASIFYLALVKGKELVFNGSSSISNLRLRQLLAPYQNPEPGEIASDRFRDGSMLRRLGVAFSDGEKGTLFLISIPDQVVPEIRYWQIETIILIVIILAFTSLAMCFWIYRGAVAPIHDLEKATQNIRDGNLDFDVKGSGVQEFDALVQDFDEMRIRLKESSESQLEYDQQSKELVSNISHDLKTPVTAIKGYVEGILDGVADTPEKMEHYLLTIRNKANDIDRLINELTVYSHIDTNRIPYNFIRLNASDYFSDCAEEMQIDLEEQGIDFSFFNYLRDEADIIADPEQLRRVVNNIIGNAVKYMDKEFSFVNLRLRDVGDFVQVEIEDNGRGISAKDLPRVFDRFYRSDTARRSHGGSGIGLSIVKKILEDHEGKVWATSKEGEGTVIYFVLKKYREEQEEDKKTGIVRNAIAKVSIPKLGRREVRKKDDALPQQDSLDSPMKNTEEQEE